MSLRYPKGSRFRTAAGSPFPISAPRHLDAGGVGPSDEHLAIYPTSPGDCPFWGSSENTTRQLRLKKWMSHENHILMTKFSKFIARRRFFFFRMTKKKRPRAVSRRRERNVTWSWRSCTTTNPMFRPRTTRSGLVAGCCDLCWMILVQGFVVAVHGVFLPLFLHLFLYYI